MITLFFLTILLYSFKIRVLLTNTGKNLNWRFLYDTTTAIQHTLLTYYLVEIFPKNWKEERKLGSYIYSHPNRTEAAYRKSLHTVNWLDKGWCVFIQQLLLDCDLNSLLLYSKIIMTLREGLSGRPSAPCL